MASKKYFEISLNNLKKDLKFDSAGICFYTQNKIMLLKTDNNKWEFLGGKVDKTDNTLLHTAIRESVEESNGSILSINNSIEDEIKNIYEYFKIKNLKRINWYPFTKFKYALFFIELDESMINDSKVYGDYEIYENKKRNINWLNFQQVDNLIADKKNLNFQIDYYILSKIRSIVSDQKNINFLKKWEIDFF